MAARATAAAFASALGDDPLYQTALAQARLATSPSKTSLPPGCGPYVAVGGDMRLITSGGCPRVADLANTQARVWSGRRWVDVWVRKLPGPPAVLYRVQLDDGACLVCAADHAWAVIDGAGSIVPVRTDALQTDYAVALPLLPEAADLSGVPAKTAYADGAAYAALMADRATRGRQLPPQLFSMAPADLGLFVAGWLDAHKGAIYGGSQATHDLKLALLRLGVRATTSADQGGDALRAVALPCSAAADIPNPANAGRTFRNLCLRHPRVVEVFRLDVPGDVYTVSAAGGGTVVVDGVTALCGFAAESSGPV